MSIVFKIASATNIGLFRLTGGRIGSSMRGQKVLLLTTVGNKSGKLRTVPLMQFDFDGKRYVIGSAGGSPKDPAWMRNLRKTPEVDVEVPGERYRARASVLTGDARAEVFNKVTQRAPYFANYQKKAGGREIPVVELTRSQIASPGFGSP
jgi:deazaflavin-dependent oxidoreductase (nitroreductase family)